jgi:hypothetical protein
MTSLMVTVTSITATIWCTVENMAAVQTPAPLDAPGVEAYAQMLARGGRASHSLHLRARASKSTFACQIS